MHIIQAFLSFGSSSIGVPILSLAIGTETSVALLSASGLILSFIVFSTQYKKICQRELLIILACVLPIMPVGYLLYSKLRFIEWALRLIMGAVLSFVAAHQIWRNMIKKEQSELSRRAIYSALGVGAVIQGMFSMGAGLINVYALTRIKDKSTFRATMTAVWIITNTISLLYRILVLHVYTKQIWMNILYAIPLIFVAYFIGNKLHKNVPNENFANVAYIVQLASGLLSIAGGVMLLL